MEIFMWYFVAGNPSGFLCGVFRRDFAEGWLIQLQCTLKQMSFFGEKLDCQTAKRKVWSTLHPDCCQILGFQCSETTRDTHLRYDFLPRKVSNIICFRNWNIQMENSSSLKFSNWSIWNLKCITISRKPLKLHTWSSFILCSRWGY